jgi:hypothetical protein
MFRVKMLVEVEMDIVSGAHDEGEAVLLAASQVAFQLEDNLNAVVRVKEAKCEYIPTWKYADEFFKEGAKK